MELYIGPIKIRVIIPVTHFFAAIYRGELPPQFIAGSNGPTFFASAKNHREERTHAVGMLLYDTTRCALLAMTWELVGTFFQARWHAFLVGLL